jgi:tetratricopeptide (TPR) repeat protein
MVLKRLLLAILIVGQVSFGIAGVVPSSIPLTAKLSELESELKDSERIDSRSALSIALSIYEQSPLVQPEIVVWSTVTYAYFLLENDSISKAEKLLSGIYSKLLNATRSDKAFYYLAEGLLRTYQGKYVVADSLYREAETLGNNGILLVLLKQARADNLRYQGKLNQSYVLWLAALDLSEELADSVEISDCYLGKGTVELLRKELDQVKTSVQVFQRFNQSVGNRKKVAYALSVLSLIDYHKNDFEASIEKNLEAFEIRKQINDLKGQGESLNNLALGYMGRKNWNQALRYLNDAVQMKTQANDFTQMTVIFNNMGHCYSRLGDQDLALKCFEQALEKGKENGQFGDVVRSYQNIVNLHSKQKQFEKAFEIQSRLMVLKDSLAKAEREDALNELEVKYETQDKEKEISLLQKEQTIITNRWLTLALGLFLAIVIGVLFIDNQKRKHRQEKQLLSAEDELQKAELKIMTDLLEYNQQKLSLYTENLLRKNEIVGQLESKLKSVVENASGEFGSEEKLMEDFSGVRILTDDDWEEFKLLFDGVHRGLLERLLISYENLTLAEQRLFLLMKLDLSTKEIANILGVSPESIKKGRYRLKKKLNVLDEQSLQEFISRF